MHCPSTGNSCTLSCVRGEICQKYLQPHARSKPKDEVFHPQHYARWKMEPIEFIAINDLPWWLANLIKYSMRYDAKDGLQDLYKGRSYLDMKIRQVEQVPRFWDKPVTEERKLNVSSAAARNTAQASIPTFSSSTSQTP